MRWKRESKTLWTCGELAIEGNGEADSPELGEFEVYRGKRFFGVFTCLKAAKTFAQGIRLPEVSP